MIARRAAGTGPRTAAALLLCAGLLWWGSVTAVVRDDAAGRLQALAELHAAAIVWLGNVAGVSAAAHGTVVQHPPTGFAYNVSLGCTHLPALLLLVVAVASAAAPAGAKVAGVALGVPLYVLLNLTRLVHLLAIGVEHPSWFALAHEVVWPALLAGVFLAYWFAWRWWAEPARPAIDRV